MEVFRASANPVISELAAKLRHRIRTRRKRVHRGIGSLALIAPASLALIGGAMELQGWKQIADYLNVSDRTAQTWARRHKMPVHHLPGAKGRVFALYSELEEWKHSGPVPVAPLLARKVIAVRLLEDELKDLRPLIAKFSSMQEFVSNAVIHYGQHLKTALHL